MPTPRFAPLFAVALAVAGFAAASGGALAQEQQSAAQQTADEQLRALYEADWAWSLREYEQQDDGEGGLEPTGRLPRVDAESQRRRLAHARETLAALDRIPADALSDAERVNAAVFRTNLEHALIDGRFRDWEMPVNSDSAFWQYLAPRQGYRTADEYRRYISRMRDIPRYFDENIANMREGLARGFTPPRATLQGRDSAIAAFAVADVEQNPFFAPLNDMPPGIPAEQREELRREARAAITDAVVPAFDELLRFFRDEYVPNTRTSLAASRLPDGRAYYAAQIRKYTTLELSAEEIHQIGLREVARIEAEMLQVMRDSGFEGSLDEFLTFLRTDPQFYARSPEELLMVSAYAVNRVNAKIGDVIGHLPRRRFTVLPVPDAIAPYYTAGRGGLESCLMNTYDLPSRPLYNIPALTLHECSPGHSLQAALSEEGQALPAFRRNTYFSGFGEGWGLYSEWLGVEMGIYRTPYEQFGRLSYEMWRAARLVIDTGIHRYGWSRERAIEYLASHTALSRREVETEVDRYISWPGQALAYKLGELTIRRLRTEAETALGERFDRRRFHDAILALGSTPLPVLEERIARFIEEESARTAPQQQAAE
ncbi:MAG TPA: DUF885 family protein [Vitreimonas sp.]|uniref:DUF885 domain-containing protein n=1 Tax=Vitreimonas sp. TaxID=3069702 RepID=UPI002D308C4F|nr:DUF885 family protein [Vitreimonas sp.]HYD88118.1 DUF885 family protein [Vitreimonas sp.]